MKLKGLLFTLYVILSSGDLLSQTNPLNGQLKGNIVDNGDIPLAHAYLFLKNYPEFSVVSNSYGEFGLSFPSVIKNDTIVVTLLGYHRMEIPLSRLAPTNNRIKLKEAIISLNEVTVTTNDNSLKNMLFNAIENIPINYPVKRHQLIGIYRKISTNYEDFTHLVEAAIVVEDLGYDRDIRRIKIKMEALRQSDEHAEIDPNVAKMKSKIRNHIEDLGEPVEPLNPIIASYPSNYIRTAYYSKSIFAKDGYRFMGIPELPKYHRFVGTEMIGADTIYHIAISGIDPPDGSSYLKINGRNHAIVEYQLSYRNGEHEVYTKFKEVGDHYYPEVIRLKSLRLINRDVGVHQMDIHTFWFDDVKTDKLEKIKSKDKLKQGQTLEPNIHFFDESFWDENTFLKNHPLEDAIIESLERNRPLREQFKRNAKD